MNVRPAVFGRQGWYPADAGRCRATLDQYRAAFGDRPTGRYAGLVPHAGWVFSGQVASYTFCALSQAAPEVVFLFGGHMGPGQLPVCMPQGAWETPLGPVAVQTELAQELQAAFDCRIESPQRFEPDNTIELQLPILKYTWPEARVLAVMTPPDDTALAIGAWAAEAAGRHGIRAVAIGSSDLTHYGANYGFTPQGTGADALRWAKEHNDKPFLEHLLALEERAALAHALAHHSACCPGAAVAAAAFARARGVEEGQLLEHTTSHEVDGRGEPRMWVGYASVVY